MVRKLEFLIENSKHPEKAEPVKTLLMNDEMDHPTLLEVYQRTINYIATRIIHSEEFIPNSCCTYVYIFDCRQGQLTNVTRYMGDYLKEEFVFQRSNILEDYLGYKIPGKRRKEANRLLEEITHTLESRIRTPSSTEEKKKNEKMTIFHSLNI